MNVRLERTRQGLTQEELGHRLGRDQSYVSQIESGTITASLDVVDQFAVALGTDPVDLLDPKLGRGSAN
ncbi:helix-turn-helix domain-containing protein [Solimonas marina]